VRLYEVTEEPEYLAVAREGMAYERAVFSSTARNWPDFLTTPPTFKVMWCHGAAGIGLGRLGGLRRESSPAICQEVETALENTQKYTGQSVDHLCCGHFGRIEVLLTAGQVLKRPQLIDIARQKATHLVQQAQQNRGYQLLGNLSSVAFHSGFFQGMAGIGYQLLRLAYPARFPVVLLWD
jgi:lantibiotic modifying enzyme